MLDEINRLLETVSASNGQLEMRLKIHTPKERVPVGADAIAFEVIHYSAALAEFLYSYTLYLRGVPEPTPYRTEVFVRFEAEFKPEWRGRSWLELSEHSADACYRLFRQSVQMRTGGYIMAGAGDVLEVSLIENWHENPWFRKFIAAGATVAALFVAIPNGLNAWRSGRDYQECVDDWHREDARQWREFELVTKFTGKFPAESYGKWQDTLSAGIASCKPPILNAGIRVNVTKGIEYEMWLGNTGPAQTHGGKPNSEADSPKTPHR